MKMNLGILPAEFGDIGFIAVMIEPVEHLVELLAENQPYDRQGKLLEFHGPVQHTAEDGCRLKICQLASGDFKFRSDELLRALESQCCKSPDIIRGNRLI